MTKFRFIPTPLERRIKLEEVKSKLVPKPDRRPEKLKSKTGKQKQKFTGKVAHGTTFFHGKRRPKALRSKNKKHKKKKKLRIRTAKKVEKPLLQDILEQLKWIVLMCVSFYWWLWHSVLMLKSTLRKSFKRLKSSRKFNNKRHRFLIQRRLQRQKG